MSDENSATERFYLLLDGEGGDQSFAEGVEIESIAVNLPPSLLPLKSTSGHLFDENADANSLALQKWGVIVPRGPRGQDLFGYISELVAWREKEQGQKVVTFQVKPDMDASAAQDWVVNVLATIDKEERPRYLLILGDLHEVSAELQIALSNRYFAGRLVFAEEADYRAYAKKVIESEMAESKVARAKAFVYIARRSEFPANRAIDDGEKNLVGPLMTLANQRFEKGKIPVKFELKNEVGVKSPKKEEFLELVRTAPSSSFLLSISHGKGADPNASDADRKAIQGALCFDEKGVVMAEDAKTGPFLSQGFWFLFACYGGGTPKHSAYQHWCGQGAVSYLPKEGENPYIAALPKAALANPQGPLAIVAHLDLA